MVVSSCCWCKRYALLHVQVVYRDPTTITHIPNYEGQPMVATLLDQAQACGATAVNATKPGRNAALGGALLLVNNFSGDKQTEAPDQPLNRSIDEYAGFTEWLCPFATGAVVGFADNRYSNGADVYVAGSGCGRYRIFPDSTNSTDGCGCVSLQCCALPFTDTPLSLFPCSPPPSLLRQYLCAVSRFPGHW